MTGKRSLVELNPLNGSNSAVSERAEGTACSGELRNVALSEISQS